MVHLATPDFSMPYNVCCMTCTLLALYVGLQLRILTYRRRDEESRLAQKKSRASKLLKPLVVCVGMGVMLLVVDDETRETVRTFASKMGFLPDSIS